MKNSISTSSFPSRSVSNYFGRRHFLKACGAGAWLWSVPGVFAEQLALTPRQTEGPFYPDRLPLDTDNDLLIVNDEMTPAVGTITHLTGRILRPNGTPVSNATVEIWQADQRGIYHHSRDRKLAERDQNFQGFGRFLTDRKGNYYFRTIKPVPYSGRTPHIHVLVEEHGRRVLTTQCYNRAEPSNQRDGVLNQLGQPEQDRLMADFRPLPASKLGELSAHFDIVLGVTPDDPHHA